MSTQALPGIRNKQLEAQARALYSDALPYHNFDHIQDTLQSAAMVVERCQEEHIRIDAEVVYFALLFHDAGYQDDHLARGFATKERYSAALAEPILRHHGVSHRRKNSWNPFAAHNRPGSPAPERVQGIAES